MLCNLLALGKVIGCDFIGVDLVFLLIMAIVFSAEFINICSATPSPSNRYFDFAKIMENN